MDRPRVSAPWSWQLGPDGVFGGCSFIRFSSATLSHGGLGEMSTMFADTLLIVFISVCTALLAEGE